MFVLAKERSELAFANNARRFARLFYFGSP